MRSEKIGSIWRRWDLHLHTPATRLSDSYGKTTDNVWNQFIDALEVSPVEVFGITDYFSCNNYFDLIARYAARHPGSTKVFFPNIEFRLSDSIDEENRNPDLHIIFDSDQAQCSRELIERFLVHLETKGKNASGARIHCADLTTESDFKSASVSFDDLLSALKKTFGDSKPYLLVFPAKNDGVKSADRGSPRKMLITNKIDKECHLFFGDSDSRGYFLDHERYGKGQLAQAKPVVSGCDAHSFSDLERLYGNTRNFPPTWIKADPTFRGLQQICFEPSDRVFIGAEPPVEKRKATQPTKILTGLRISKIPEYDGAKGSWFKKVELPLNPELTVIIGNKGSGKSAIVDIIGLLGDSRLEEYFAFLSDRQSNRKFRQKGYSENFTAEMTWQSGPGTSKLLSVPVDENQPETVRYLPQNYFERLTNDLQIEKFRSEIEDVVFSHVELSERMNTHSFKALQDLKTLQSKTEVSDLKVRLRELHIEILEMEEKATLEFLKVVEGKLSTKRQELSAIAATPPNAVEKPETQGELQDAQATRLEKLSALIEELNSKAQRIVEQLGQKKNRKQRLVTLKETVTGIQNSLLRDTEKLRPEAIALDLDIDAIIKPVFELKSIEEQAEAVSAEIAALEKANEPLFVEDFDFGSLTSAPDIHAASEYLQTIAGTLNDSLSAPQREYQTYIDKLSAWNAQKAAIEGDPTDPQPGTIRDLDRQISFLRDELPQKIIDARERRKAICTEIFQSKRKILEFYVDLKKSVDERLKAVRTTEFSVDIDAAFIAINGFEETFFKHIRRNRRGPFYGNVSGDQKLSELKASVVWNDFSTILTFIEKVIEEMHGSDQTGPYSFEDQVVDIKPFYDFLYSMEYFTPSYELRLGGKDLNELSPGEKGLLLLIFYLQLDKDNIPLVIDQPEDNLDNESIFNILAACIREAKKSRQVILVTHNPNLAVGADAEQIIYVDLDKANNYKFSYECGSIENPRINDRIVKVLEGSQPAFIKRRLKYHIS